MYMEKKIARALFLKVQGSKFKVQGQEQGLT
jgi:hypothetical protein